MIFALRYFAERGTWDNTLENFMNSDGDPSQFAVRILFNRDICYFLINPL